MTNVELLTKVCGDCRQEKPISEFHKHKSSIDGYRRICAPCSIARSRAWQEKKRAEIGEDAWNERNREIVKRSRQANGYKAATAYSKARQAAVRALIERHRAEFGHLLLLSRRGELEEASA